MVKQYTIEDVRQESDDALAELERLIADLEDSYEEAVASFEADRDESWHYTPRAGECEVTAWLKKRGALARQTADRLVAEIVSAVADGRDLPDEWYQLDTYADCGEPNSAYVCELVRGDLCTTGIKV